MKTQYTPGPWRIEDETYVLSGSEVIGKFGRYTTHPLNKIDQANARLVAAAPELLEALKQLQFSLVSLANATTTPKSISSVIYKIITVDVELYDVIAKATGETIIKS